MLLKRLFHSREPALFQSALIGAAAAAFVAAAPLFADEWRQRGSIEGKVTLAGFHAKPRPLPVFKNRAFCGPAVPDETLLVHSDRGVRNAAIVLEPLSGRVAPKPRRVTLDNARCAFAPHVQIAALGSELRLKNSDPILHTVHARLGGATLFNVG